MEEEVIDALKEEDIEFNSSAVPELMRLLNEYGLTIEDLCAHWLAFSTNHSEYDILTKESIPHFNRLELAPNVKKQITKSFDQYHHNHNNNNNNINNINTQPIYNSESFNKLIKLSNNKFINKSF